MQFMVPDGGTQKRAPGDGRAQLRELRDLQRHLLTTEHPSSTSETSLVKSMPLLHCTIAQQQAGNRSLPRLSEARFEPVAAAATRQQSSAGKGKQRGSLVESKSSRRIEASFGNAFSPKFVREPTKLLQEPPQIVSGNQAGSFLRQSVSENRRIFPESRPKSFPAKPGKVHISGLNSQLAAFCEEERARVRARTSSLPLIKSSSSTPTSTSASPYVSISNRSSTNQTATAGSVWLALCVLVSTLWAFFSSRVFAALIWYTRAPTAIYTADIVESDERTTVTVPRTYTEHSKKAKFTKVSQIRSIELPLSSSISSHSLSVKPRRRQDTYRRHSEEPSYYTSSCSPPSKPEH